MDGDKIQPAEVEAKEISTLYDLNDFDCGDMDLNEFLKKDSFEYKKQLIARTFLIIYQEKVVAFFSILNDSIKLKMEETDQTPNLRRLHEYPAIKIGRLGVDNNYKKQGMGTIGIRFIIGLAENINKISASRFITVDSYHESLPFYEKMGFVRNLLYEKKSDFVSMRLDLLEKE